MISESESSAAAACASAPSTEGAPYAGTRNPAKPTCFSATLLTPSLTPLEPESCAESWGSAEVEDPDLPATGGRESELEDMQDPSRFYYITIEIWNLEDMPSLQLIIAPGHGIHNSLEAFSM